MNISFGSDPEFMLTKEGHYYSAINLVKGTSEERIKIGGHEFYWDNVMAECAIKPGIGEHAVIKNMRECFRIYANMVKPYWITVQASQDYPTEALDCEEAQRAGCAPDMCAYTYKKKRPPKKLFQETALRTCGGHIHLGTTDPGNPLISFGPEPIFIVYLLDLFLAVPSLYIDHDPTSAARRKLYGQAGRFREKDYGLEYRALGNFWLASPELVRLTYRICNWLVQYVAEGHAKEWWKFNEEVFYEVKDKSKAFKCLQYDPKALKRCIDKGDTKAGKQYLSLVKMYLPDTLWAQIEKHLEPRKYDFYREWGIDKP